MSKGKSKGRSRRARRRGRKKPRERARVRRVARKVRNKLLGSETVYFDLLETEQRYFDKIVSYMEHYGRDLVLKLEDMRNEARAEGPPVHGGGGTPS